MGVDRAAPDPTTLSRRSQSLAVAFRRIPSSGPLHRIVDSTGLSIVGEGEWAAVHHGGRGHRGGKTLHRAVDRGGVIVAHALTEPTVDDATMGIDLIATGDDAIARVTADAAYETVAFYEAAEMRDATVVVPPSKTARVSRRRPRARARDRTITDVRTLDRRRWKQEAGYQLQARVENAFFRYTSIIGDRLRARSRDGRVAESVVACTVLNQMPELGRPESYSIGRCLGSGLGSVTVSFESCTSAADRWLDEFRPSDSPDAWLGRCPRVAQQDRHACRRIYGVENVGSRHSASISTCGSPTGCSHCNASCGPRLSPRQNPLS